MARCPTCGVTVAFHSDTKVIASKMDCWTCGEPLLGEWKEEPGHLGRWVASVDEWTKKNRERSRLHREAKRRSRGS